MRRMYVLKDGLRDHIHVKFVSHRCVMIECDRVNGLHKLLEIL